MEKNNKIQNLRALAIISVVLIHTCPSGCIQIFLRPFLNFCVALFLFLSGYLTKIDNNWKKIYIKRITRVLIPYIIWSIFYSCLSCVDVKKMIINLFTTKSTGTLYYIFVYIQLVLLTPLLGKVAKSRYCNVIWIISPISTFIFSYFYWLTGFESNRFIQIIWSISCLGWLTFYYLGMLLGNNLKKIRLSTKKIMILYIISIFIQISEGYWLYMIGYENCGTQLKLSAYLTSTIFIIISYKYIISKKYNYNNKLLTALGNYSFGIYLCHIFWVNLLNHFANSVPFLVNSILVLLFSLLSCIIGNKLLGKRSSRFIGLV